MPLADVLNDISALEKELLTSNAAYEVRRKLESLQELAADLYVQQEVDPAFVLGIGTNNPATIEARKTYLEKLRSEPLVRKIEKIKKA